MGISDSILSVLPDAYRRDFIVLGIGMALGSAWWHFESRIDTAYAAAQQTPEIQHQQATQAAQIATIQSTATATKAEVDELVSALLQRAPLPTATPVPTRPTRRRPP